jgi:hypothetical protein
MNDEIMVSVRALVVYVMEILGQTPTETERHHETYQSGNEIV